MSAKKSEKPLKDRMIDAALALSSEEGWAEISFDQIIAAAGADVDEAREYFDDKSDVLTAYGRRLDRTVMDDVSFDDDMSEREKIFDLLMARFDALNENRGAVISILEGFRSDPKQMIISLPHLARSMERTLELANVESDGASGAIKVTGLMGVYLYVVRTWKEDDSADMAKTMAALDQALDKAEMAANSLSDGNILSAVTDMCSRFTPKN